MRSKLVTTEFMTGRAPVFLCLPVLYARKATYV